MCVYNQYICMQRLTRRGIVLKVENNLDYSCGKGKMSRTSNFFNIFRQDGACKYSYHLFSGFQKFNLPGRFYPGHKQAIFCHEVI